MSHGNSAEAETMQGAFQLGYSRKQVIQCVALALLLHGTIIGAYLVLGSEKKPPATKVADKSEKKDVPASGKEGDTPKSTTDSGKTDSKSTAETIDDATKKAPEKAKGAEASKASDLPKAPDSDIDSILKSK